MPIIHKQGLTWSEMCLNRDRQASSTCNAAIDMASFCTPGAIHPPLLPLAAPLSTPYSTVCSKCVDLMMSSAAVSGCSGFPPGGVTRRIMENFLEEGTYKSWLTDEHNGRDPLGARDVREGEITRHIMSKLR